MNLSLVGNTQAKEQITRILQSRRFSHAYLFCGEEGTGKRMLAKEFAKGILCEQDPIFCGDCPHCRKIEKNIHPDVTSLSGGEGKNSFHAEEIRKLIAQMYIKPNEGVYRIFLLENIQNLSDTAANSLLKFLEEPPSHVIFLLTCSDKQKVLPTILSRCSLIPLISVSRKECKEEILRRYPKSFSEDEIENAVSMSGQVIGKALQLLKDPEQQKALKAARHLKISLEKKGALPFLLALAPLEEDRRFCHQALLLFDRLLLGAIHGQAISKTEESPLARLYSPQQLMKMQTLTREVLASLDQNANIRLLLTWYSSQMPESCH